MTSAPTIQTGAAAVPTVEDPRRVLRMLLVVPPASLSSFSLSSFSKEKIMASDGKYVSLYEQRVKLVAAALTEHSELTSSAATELAAHVLYALDHIPERVRYSGK